MRDVVKSLFHESCLPLQVLHTEIRNDTRRAGFVPVLLQPRRCLSIAVLACGGVALLACQLVFRGMRRVSHGKCIMRVKPCWTT